jgi:hypothetical protein
MVGYSVGEEVDLPRAIPDDTEVVPPKSKKQIQRSQQISMPSPLIDDEPKKGALK